MSNSFRCSWWLGRNMKIWTLSFVSKSWVTETLENEKIPEDLIMRVAQQGSSTASCMTCGCLTTNSTAPSMQYNMFKSSDIGSCMRRTGLDLHFQTSHHRNLFLDLSSGFKPPRRDRWRHSPATSRSLGFWPPVRHYSSRCRLQTATYRYLTS